MLKNIYITIIIFFIKNFPGSIGIKLRYFFYKPLFNSCGSGVKIGCGVVINNFHQINFGNNIRIDDYTIINVGDLNSNRIIHYKKNSEYNSNNIRLVIKDYVHINQFCLISSFNYLEINNYCTFSAGVKIYNVSHHFRDPKNKSKITYANNLDKSIGDNISLYVTKIILESNVFVSINSIILDGTIGKNTFIYPNSLVFKNIKDNSLFKVNKVIGKRFL